MTRIAAFRILAVEYGYDHIDVRNFLDQLFDACTVHRTMDEAELVDLFEEYFDHKPYRNAKNRALHGR